MASTDDFVSRSYDGPVRLEQSGGAGGSRSVKRKDQRLDSMDLQPMEAQAMLAGKQNSKEINKLR